MTNGADGSYGRRAHAYARVAGVPPLEALPLQTSPCSCLVRAACATHKRTRMDSARLPSLTVSSTYSLPSHTCAHRRATHPIVCSDGGRGTHGTNMQQLLACVTHPAQVALDQRRCHEAGVLHLKRHAQRLEVRQRGGLLPLRLASLQGVRTRSAPDFTLLPAPSPLRWSVKRNALTCESRKASMRGRASVSLPPCSLRCESWNWLMSRCCSLLKSASACGVRRWPRLAV